MKQETRIWALKTCIIVTDCAKNMKYTKFKILFKIHSTSAAVISNEKIFRMNAAGCIYGKMCFNKK